MVTVALKLRLLLLARKAMTNLDSILKSRDITLPTKVHLVKAMVFLVVIYGCESWTIKKAERQRIDAFDHYLDPSFLPGMQERSLRTVQRRATSLRAQVQGYYWALSRGYVVGPYSASI